MTRGERGRLIVAVGVVGVLAAYVWLQFRITTDIAHFLPDRADGELATLSREITESELSRTMILALEAEDTGAAIAAGRAFEARLRAEPRVAEAISFLEGGPTEGLDRALFELYAPRALSFLAPDVETARERVSEAGLRRAARRLRDELAGPLSPLVSRVAARDPFLTIPTLFERMASSRAGGLRVVDGRFLGADGRSAILFLGTRASAMDAHAQRPLLDGIEAAFEATRAEWDGPLHLDQSGLNRFATWAASAIERDIQRVGIVSSLLLCALLLLLFRSLRFVGLAAIPVTVGVVAGCAAVLALFGRLHGITLAFGASLIGVSIDYVVHLYCHHSIVQPEGGPSASLRAIRRPLATGAVTTVAGFAALAASSLVGLREVACFSVVGILSAYLATVALVPSLMGRGVAPVRARERLTRAIGRGFRWLGEEGRVVAAAPIAATIFAALMLPGARWNPDLASLNRMDAGLIAEDERVRERVAKVDQMRFVAAIGDDEGQALDTNDRVASRLRDAVEAGELESQRSLAPLLPGPTRQLEVASVAQQDAELPDRLERVFTEAGFADGAFAPFRAALVDPLPPALRFEDLLTSPAGSLVRSFRIQLGDRVAFLTFLEGVTDAEAIEARLADLPDAVFVHQAELLNAAQSTYQRSTIRLLGWGLVAVLVLLALRYREWRRTVVAFVPSVVAAAVTVSVLTLAGRGLDLISLTALLFVVSMGVDYSVFLVDAYDEPDARSVSAALTGALLACLSTVAAFGLLALSAHPVLSNLGLTAAVGIGTSLLLAPTTLALVRPGRGEGPVRREGKERST